LLVASLERADSQRAGLAFVGCSSRRVVEISGRRATGLEGFTGCAAALVRGPVQTGRQAGVLSTARDDHTLAVHSPSAINAAAVAMTIYEPPAHYFLQRPILRRTLTLLAMPRIRTVYTPSTVVFIGPFTPRLRIQAGHCIL